MSSEQIRSDFDRIAQLGDRFDSGSDRYDRLLLSFVPAEATRILEVGCGTGRLTSKLVAAGRQIVAVDISPEMIARARASVSATDQAEFISGDFLTIDFGSHGFDCVISVAALHHMSPEAALVKMRELVRPGGRLIIQDLRSCTSIADRFVMGLVICYEAGFRLVRTGWPLSPPKVRRAWNEHGAHEAYLSHEQACELFERVVPGSDVTSQRACRYTAIWTNPG